MPPSIPRIPTITSPTVPSAATLARNALPPGVTAHGINIPPLPARPDFSSVTGAGSAADISAASTAVDAADARDRLIRELPPTPELTFPFRPPTIPKSPIEVPDIIPTATTPTVPSLAAVLLPVAKNSIKTNYTGMNPAAAGTGLEKYQKEFGTKIHNDITGQTAPIESSLLKLAQAVMSLSAAVAGVPGGAPGGLQVAKIASIPMFAQLPKPPLPAAIPLPGSAGNSAASDDKWRLTIQYPVNTPLSIMLASRLRDLGSLREIEGVDPARVVLTSNINSQLLNFNSKFPMSVKYELHYTPTTLLNTKLESPEIELRNKILNKVLSIDTNGRTIQSLIKVA